LALSGVARRQVFGAEMLSRSAQARKGADTMAGVTSRSSILSPVMERITLSLRGDGGTILASRCKADTARHERRAVRELTAGTNGTDALVPWSDRETSEVGMVSVKARPALWKQSGAAGQHPGR